MHHFSLKSVNKERRHNLTASVTLCRGKHIKNRKARPTCPNFEGPILNKDRLYATPAFILPSEKVPKLSSRLNTSKVPERFFASMNAAFGRLRTITKNW
jgi:hypothetical protein